MSDDANRPHTNVPTLLTIVARRVRQRRLDLQLTQEDLAAKSGLAVRHLQKIEAGEVNLTLRTLASLSAALDVKANRLLVDEESS